MRSFSHHLYNNLEQRMYKAITSAYLVSRSDFASLLEQWKLTCRDVLPQSVRARAEQRIALLLGFLGST
jgi:hypothetical protein